MSQARSPPTDLTPGSKFALHFGDDLMTVWAHHRQMGLHEATWECVDEYEIDGRVEVSGRGTVIRDGGDVWYLVDDFEDIHIHGRTDSNRSRLF